MKQEYIVAFMTKNSKKFRESDYSTVQNLLAQVDDLKFPLLIGKSFEKAWPIVTTIFLCALGIFLAIGCIAVGSECYHDGYRGWDNSWHEAYIAWGDVIYSIFLGTMSISSVALGFYLILILRKQMALKELQTFISNLK